MSFSTKFAAIAAAGAMVLATASGAVAADTENLDPPPIVASVESVETGSTTNGGEIDVLPTVPAESSPGTYTPTPAPSPTADDSDAPGTSARIEPQVSDVTITVTPQRARVGTDRTITVTGARPGAWLEFSVASLSAWAQATVDADGIATAVIQEPSWGASPTTTVTVWAEWWDDDGQWQGREEIGTAEFASFSEPELAFGVLGDDDSDGWPSSSWPTITAGQPFDLRRVVNVRPEGWGFSNWLSRQEIASAVVAGDLTFEITDNNGNFLSAVDGIVTFPTDGWNSSVAATYTNPETGLSVTSQQYVFVNPAPIPPPQMPENPELLPARVSISPQVGGQLPPREIDIRNLPRDINEVVVQVIAPGEETPFINSLVHAWGDTDWDTSSPDWDWDNLPEITSNRASTTLWTGPGSGANGSYWPVGDYQVFVSSVGTFTGWSGQVGDVIAVGQFTVNEAPVAPQLPENPELLPASVSVTPEVGGQLPPRVIDVANIPTELDLVAIQVVAPGEEWPFSTNVVNTRSGGPRPPGSPGQASTTVFAPGQGATKPLAGPLPGPSPVFPGPSPIPAWPLGEYQVFVSATTGELIGIGAFTVTDSMQEPPGISFDFWWLHVTYPTLLAEVNLFGGEGFGRPYGGISVFPDGAWPGARQLSPAEISAALADGHLTVELSGPSGPIDVPADGIITLGVGEYDISATYRNPVSGLSISETGQFSVHPAGPTPGRPGEPLGDVNVMPAIAPVGTPRQARLEANAEPGATVNWRLEFYFPGFWLGTRIPGAEGEVTVDETGFVNIDFIPPDRVGDYRIWLTSEPNLFTYTVFSATINGDELAAVGATEIAVAAPDGEAVTLEVTWEGDAPADAVQIAGRTAVTRRAVDWQAVFGVSITEPGTYTITVTDSAGNVITTETIDVLGGEPGEPGGPVDPEVPPWPWPTFPTWPGNPGLPAWPTWPGHPNWPGQPNWPGHPGSNRPDSPGGHRPKPTVPAKPGAPGHGHPVTGADTALVALGGVLLATAGGGLMVAGKRRK